MAGTLKSLLVKLGVDAGDFNAGMDSAEGKTKQLSDNFDNLSRVGGGILLGATAAVVAGATAIGALGYGAVMAAGRVEQLIGVNRVLGENLGISDELIRSQSAAMREQGIEAAVVEEALAKMMQAELDLAGATDIAKVAQNAAVIAGTNSSESMSAIIHGITTLNPLVLRGQGLVVDQAAAYDELATSLGKSAVDLTGAEKQQAMYNAVMKAGVKIQGAYDESMKNPVKQLGSLKRLFNDVAVAAGGPLLKGFSSIIAAFSDLVKWFGSAVEEGGELRPLFDAAGVWFENIGAKIAVFVKNAVTNIPKFIQGFKDAFAWLQENKGVVVGILAGLGVAVAAFAYTVAAAMVTAMIPMLPVIAIMLAVAGIAYLVYEAWTNNWGGIQEKTASVIEFIIGVFNWFKETAIGIWTNFLAAIQPLIDAFTAALSGDWYAFGENLRIAWDNMWTAIWQAFVDFGVWMIETVIQLVTDVVAWFQETDWLQVGTNIVQGIADGILNGIKIVGDAVAKVVTAAWNAAKGFLGIHSPSKLFAGIGENMMLGMAQGVGDMSGVPVGVTVGATKSIAGAATATAPAGSGSGGGIDIPELARALRDVILQVME